MKAVNIGFNTEYPEKSPSLDELNNLSGFVLLEFGTPWCGHCQAVQDTLRECVDEYSDLLHIKVFDGKGKRLGRQFSVKLWPTLILLKDGKETERMVRFSSADQVHELLTNIEIT